MGTGTRLTDRDHRARGEMPPPQASESAAGARLASGWTDSRTGASLSRNALRKSLQMRPYASPGLKRRRVLRAPHVSAVKAPRRVRTVWVEVWALRGILERSGPVVCNSDVYPRIGHS